MSNHFIFNFPLEPVGIIFKTFNLLKMPSESIHVFIKVRLNTFPENKKSEINIIKEFIDLYNQVFGCSGENWHLSGLLCYINKYKEKDINDCILILLITFLLLLFFTTDNTD